jgi:hypothetical protein
VDEDGGDGGVSPETANNLKAFDAKWRAAKKRLGEQWASPGVRAYVMGTIYNEKESALLGKAVMCSWANAADFSAVRSAMQR